MENHILGEYGFANSYAINMDTPSWLGNQTVIHEALHMEFTLQSSYGNFMHMNRRLEVADGRFLYINKILAKHCRKVQEAASVFAEITYLVRMRSFATAEQYIQKLRENNREYYNYLKPLLPFLTFLEENKGSTANCKLPITEILNIVKSMVLISLDVDLTQLSPDVFRKEKELDRHIAEELCPNRIFHDIIKQVLNILEQDATPEVIQNDLQHFTVTWRPVYGEDELRLMLERHRQFFEKLYQDSPNYPVLIDILTEFRIKAMDPADILGCGIPMTGNPQYSFEKGDMEEIVRRSKQDKGVLYILGDMKSAFSEISRKYPIPPRYCGMPKNRFLFTFLDYAQKKQYSVLLDLKQAKQLCRDIAAPIVVNYKVYPAMRKKLLCPVHVPVIIYCDRSYKSAVEVIRSHTETEKRFHFVSYRETNMGFEAFILELETGFYFLLPMMELSFPLLYQDIQNGVLRLKQDPAIIDDALLNTIDTVVNCIFYY